MFTPYHHFTNCGRLESTIDSLKESGNVPDDIVKGYRRYHFALIHKIKCARHHLDSLIDLMSTTELADALSKSSNFMFLANMYLDGFFYTCGSAMDILAREVLTYFAIPLPTQVYFQTAKRLLRSNRPGDALISRFDDPSWRNDFSMYRNAVTHERIIAGNFNIEVTIDGDTEAKTLTLPLPDNPRVDVMARTFRTNPDVLEYCNLHLKRLLILTNTVYGEINARIITNGNLPL